VKAISRYVLTGAVVLVAVAIALYMYWEYVTNPWTRDGQVRAQVIQITPRVSAPIVKLPIEDNQFVKTGDLLFAMDPRTFQAALNQARAQLDETRDQVAALSEQVEAAKAAVAVEEGALKRAEASIAEAQSEIEKSDAEYKRQQELLPQGATSKRMVERAKASYEVSVQQKVQAQADKLQSASSVLQAQATLAEAKAKLGAPGEDNAQLRTAIAAVEDAKLNLEFTEVRAPVDGYVTNLELRLGSQGVANQPALALVDINSYWVVGYFKENTIADVHGGERAVVTLMTYPDKPLEGAVKSLGWGIYQDDGSTAADLLPSISPTFEWIRLAQRIPVRIHLTKVPDGIKLRVGTTASVLVMTGTKAAEDGQTAAVPRALQ